MVNKTIKIKCKGGNIRFIEPKIIKYFNTFQNILDDIEEQSESDDIEEQSESDEIELNCPLEVVLVNKTIEFAKENYHNLNNKINSIDDLSKIEKKYIPRDLNKHLDLIKTCNFLHFDYMLQILCKSLGLKIRIMPAIEQKKILKYFD